MKKQLPAHKSKERLLAAKAELLEVLSDTTEKVPFYLVTKWAQDARDQLSAEKIDWKSLNEAALTTLHAMELAASIAFLLRSGRLSLKPDLLAA